MTHQLFFMLPNCVNASQNTAQIPQSQSDRRFSLYAYQLLEKKKKTKVIPAEFFLKSKNTLT